MKTKNEIKSRFYCLLKRESNVPFNPRIFLPIIKSFLILVNSFFYKQGAQGLQAFEFYVVTIKDEHMKPRFKRKRKG